MLERLLQWEEHRSLLVSSTRRYVVVQLAAAKFVNQLTLTATAPPAVLASGGTTSGNTTHGMGARPILKTKAKAKTDVAESARL